MLQNRLPKNCYDSSNVILNNPIVNKNLQDESKDLQDEFKSYKNTVENSEYIRKSNDDSVLLDTYRTSVQITSGLRDQLANEGTEYNNYRNDKILKALENTVKEKLTVQILRKAKLHHEANKISRCGTYYTMVTCKKCTKQNHKHSTLCKSKFCPRCQKLRSNTLMSKYRDILNDMKSPYFLTLTIKNVVHLQQHDIDRLINNFHKMRRQVFWLNNVKGGFYSVESNVGKDGKHNLHLHAIYDGKYIEPAIIKNAWYRLTGDSYIINIKRADKNSIAEVFKYMTKILEYGDNINMLREFFYATKNKRMTNTFGNIYGIKATTDFEYDKYRLIGKECTQCGSKDLIIETWHKNELLKYADSVLE